MSELTNRPEGSASSFGVLYPTHYLMALVPNGEVAMAAANALVEAGFGAEEVVAFPPAVFVELVKAHRENIGLWSQFVDSLSRIAGTEATYIELDLELGRRGAGAVVVRAEGEAAKEKARFILKRANPLAMRYYAHRSIEVDIEHSHTRTPARQSGAD